MSTYTHITSFFDALKDSGHLDAELHRRLSVALSPRSYKLGLYPLIQLFENEITKQHGIILEQPAVLAENVQADSHLKSSVPTILPQTAGKIQKANTTQPFPSSKDNSCEDKKDILRQDFYREYQKQFNAAKALYARANKITALHAWLERDTNDKQHLEDAAIKGLPYAAYYGCEVMFAKMLACIPKEKKLAVLLSKVTINKKVTPSTILELASKYPETLKMALVALSAVDKAKAILTLSTCGNTILHRFTQNPKIFEQELKELSVEDRVNAILKANKYGNTVLHKTTQTPESFRIALKELPTEVRAKAIMEANNYGATVLHKATQNVDSLKLALAELPLEEKARCIMAETKYEITALHMAAYNSPAAFELALGALPLADKFKFVVGVNNDFSLFQIASSDYQTFKLALAIIPDRDKAKAIMAVFTKGDNGIRLRVADNNANFCESPLRILPANKRYKGTNWMDFNIAYNFECFKFALDMLSKADKQKVVMTVTNDGNIVLHHATKNFDSFKLALDILSAEEKLNAVMTTNMEGLTALHQATWNSESFKLALETLPAEKRAQAILTATKKGNTVLHEATKNAESFKLALEALPAKSRYEALMKVNSENLTVLMFSKKPGIIRQAIESLPPADKQKIISWYTHILLQAIAKVECFQLALSALPVENRPSAIMRADEYQSTILHRATQNPESFKLALKILPIEDRPKAIMKANENGVTVLHLAAQKPENFKLALEALPKDVVPTAINAATNAGSTVIQLASRNPECFELVKNVQSIKHNHSLFFQIKTALSRSSQPENSSIVPTCCIM